MVKKIIGAILIILALICVGATVYEFFAAKGEMRIWSANVLGAAGFHAVCMIIASFLLARPAVKEEPQGKEE
jgi:hypothetical protein